MCQDSLCDRLVNNTDLKNKHMPRGPCFITSHCYYLNYSFFAISQPSVVSIHTRGGACHGSSLELGELFLGRIECLMIFQEFLYEF